MKSQQAKLASLGHSHQEAVQQLTAEHHSTVANLKRKHNRLSQEYVDRINELEDENESLRAENTALTSKWNHAFTRHTELLRTQEELKQVNMEWERERQERLKAEDALEAVTAQAWTWEMMFKYQGGMPPA